MEISYVEFETAYKEKYNSTIYEDNLSEMNNGDINQTETSLKQSILLSSLISDRLKNSEMTADEIESAFNNISSKMLMYVLLNIYYQIPDNHLYQVFKSAYSMSYFNHYEDYDGFEDLFYRVSELMPDAEKADLFGESKKITLYRGEASKSIGIEDAMSFTTHRPIAEWFASRFGEGIVYEVEARKTDIIAKIDDRNEREIVLFPGRAKIVDSYEIIQGVNDQAANVWKELSK
ncbi:hypothetical protein [Acidaminobacter hydrogenoformans]|uniref:Uncharacterized protein n=1 Tax=Acidaminobacter hydrogenoformans DSM 2784 TaxID=1120920 RepID=A0A1G5S6U5_9FIRM|nr:hypothetical protein [Acidaminobacter hydrogenoformans]SCZ82085.1 hypothetical protein SAMN03080599_03342 [Acidaminobacter hydrogenoformans DSM 2784]